MIISFYDRQFNGLQNNASLVVDKSSYKLIKRPVKQNDLSATCEPFTEDIQPTFLIVKNDRGNYVYGSLAGIPTLNAQNKTEITGTDLKTLFSSDIKITPTEYALVSTYLTYLFTEWNLQVNQNSFTCEFNINTNASVIAISDLMPTSETKIVNCYEEMSLYFNRYNLYLDSKIDLVNKKVVFTVGCTMKEERTIKLWEYGIKNYGKWVASVNETQGYYNWTAGTKWILTSDNQITSDTTKRDIYPIKRKIINDTESLQKSNIEALTLLLDSLYNENIDIDAISNNLIVDFETKFAVYIKKGGGLYKYLPCGELEYNFNGLKRIQIGYRYSDINYI